MHSSVEGERGRRHPIQGGSRTRCAPIGLTVPDVRTDAVSQMMNSHSILDEAVHASNPDELLTTESSLTPSTMVTMDEKGSCPLCHRLDATHRVVIGRFERTVCRQCADGYKRT